MDLALIIPAGILLGCLIGLSWFAGSDAPYVPSKIEKIKKVLKLVNLKNKRSFSANKTFYELGSGDGRVVLEAAKLGANAFGIEQSWIRVLYSRWKAHQQNLSNAKFIHGNIFAKNYQGADIVFIYLLHQGVDKLESKLKKELKKGSIIITQTYHFKNLNPYKKSGDFQVYRV